MNILDIAREVMNKPELTQEEADHYLDTGLLNLLTVKSLARDLSDQIDDDIYNEIIKRKPIDLK